jgi:glyoxylase-like metal-dependent hydrolase (beta-lactamase superfamily II)
MEIIPEIHQVDGVNGNCYIIIRDGLTVIDTGLPGSGKKILAYIRDWLHRDPAEITTIILTHFHVDHIGAVAFLKSAAPKAKVAIGAGDEKYVDGTLQRPMPLGFRGLRIRIGRFFMRTEPFTPDIVLADGDRISGLLCVALPGHTPGSIGLLDEKSKAFFSGDILRSDGKTVTGGPPEYTMDLAQEHASLRKVAALSFDILLPGHGVPLRPGASEKVREFVNGILAGT